MGSKSASHGDVMRLTWLTGKGGSSEFKFLDSEHGLLIAANTAALARMHLIHRLLLQSPTWETGMLYSLGQGVSGNVEPSE